jgi:two-component system sensor histidine kinase YesM
VSARSDDRYLYLAVEDSGQGIPAAKLQELNESLLEKKKKPVAKKAPPKKDGATMNNLGIENVNERLKLLYGTECGLSLESAEGRFTRVTLKIRKEGDNVSGFAV